MAKNKKSYFWAGYADLMTSLFFVMLLLFILLVGRTFSESNKLLECEKNNKELIEENKELRLLASSNVKYIDSLKNIVKEEDKSKPMSDEKISMILKEEDIKVSRRTVAKYREEFGIKSSALRKRI